MYCHHTGLIGFVCTCHRENACSCRSKGPHAFFAHFKVISPCVKHIIINVYTCSTLDGKRQSWTARCFNSVSIQSSGLGASMPESRCSNQACDGEPAARLRTTRLNMTFGGKDKAIPERNPRMQIRHVDSPALQGSGTNIS